MEPGLRPSAATAIFVRMSVWTIRAEYDAEAKVWWVAESDLPGLAADAETLEGLATKAGSMLPDLLAIHEDALRDKEPLEGPHRIRIIAHHEHVFDVAA
jgi:hypothetical protein